MAVTTAANVKKASADNDVLVGANFYKQIRVVNGANASNVVTIRKISSSGEIIWQSKVLAANEVEESQAEISAGFDLFIDMAQTGGVLYLYSC